MGLNSRKVALCVVLALACLGPALARARVYEQVNLRATNRVKTWVSRPQPAGIVYLHVYADSLDHELDQQLFDPCRARYQGFGLYASVFIPGCVPERDPGGPLHLRYVSLAHPTTLLVRLTDSPERVPITVGGR